MKLSLFAIIPTLLAPIAAQAKAKCDAQYQVDSCVKSTDAIIKGCGTDPACVCQRNKEKALCYTVCPNDEVNVGQAKLQDAQIAAYCSAPGALPTTVSKSTDKPTSTSADSSDATKPSSGSSKDKDSGSSDKSSDKTSGNTSSTTKPGNSANSQYSSASFVAISMGIIASFL